MWLHREDLMGVIKGYIKQNDTLINFRYLPKIGYITILLNDYPSLKYLMIGIMSILVITAKDP